MKISVDKLIWFLKKRRYRTPPSQSRPVPFHPSPHNKSHFPYHFQLIHVSFNIEDIFSNRVSIVCRDWVEDCLYGRVFRYGVFIVFSDEDVGVADK